MLTNPVLQSFPIKKLDGKPEEKRMRSGIGVKELSFPSQNRFLT